MTLARTAAAAAVAAASALSAAPSPARAEAVLARYEVRAGGLNVMRAEVLFDLSGPRYRVQSRVRPVGVAAAFGGGGEQVSATEGNWRGGDPVPRRHTSEGEWRGARRALHLDYAPVAAAAGAAAPVLRVLEPPLEPEREPVPDALKRGTVDGLSAVAKLLRAVAETGRCEGEAPVFDGRRRSDFRAWTEGLDQLQRGATGAFAGPALRCAFLGTLVAGRHAAQERADGGGRPPQPVVAWVARPLPGRAAVPVLIEFQTRWFGTVRAVLAGAEPAGAS